MQDGSNKDLIGGRYRLDEPIGRGGMGTVWQGYDSLLKRAVAIKAVRFPAELAGGDVDGLRARFLREARSAAQLTHPGIVTVFDVAQEAGRAFIVMELVDAPTLEELVDGNGPLSPRRAAAIGGHVLAALRAAHEQGIVHRDVKPGNVMVPSAGPAKLADFGIAFVQEDTRLTGSGLILGSPSYMSPEQAQGHESNARSDLWSLGATLYFALEGVAPFARGQTMATLQAIIEEDPRPPARAEALAPVILGLLSKDPDVRPAAPEVATALERVAGRAAPPPPAPPVTGTPAPVARRARPTARRPGRVAATLIVLLLVGGAALFFALTGDQKPSGSDKRAGGDSRAPGSRHRAPPAPGAAVAAVRRRRPQAGRPTRTPPERSPSPTHPVGTSWAPQPRSTSAIRPPAPIYGSPTPIRPNRRRSGTGNPSHRALQAATADTARSA